LFDVRLSGDRLPTFADRQSPVLGLRIRGKHGGPFCDVNALAAGMDRESLPAARRRANPLYVH
jgi:hypothetical protein